MPPDVNDLGRAPFFPRVGGAAHISFFGGTAGVGADRGGWGPRDGAHTILREGWRTYNSSRGVAHIHFFARQDDMRLHLFFSTFFLLSKIIIII